VGYRKDALRAGLTFTSGFLLVSAPMFLALSQVQHFAFCISVLPFGGERASLPLRAWKILHLLPAAPLIMVAGWRIAGKWGADRTMTALAVTATALALFSVFPYTSFYPRYMLPVFPLAAIGVAIAFRDVFRPQPGARLRKDAPGLARAAKACLLAASFVHVSGLVYSITMRQERPDDQNEIVNALSSGQGHLYTGDPIWAVESGRPLVPGYYACDPRAPVLSRVTGPRDFDRGIDAADTVLLDHWLSLYFDERNFRHLESRFNLVMQSGKWQLWERKAPILRARHETTDAAIE
jgi:hypothetical protein